MVTFSIINANSGRNRYKKVFYNLVLRFQGNLISPGRWVAKYIGRWVARLGRWVANQGRWCLIGSACLYGSSLGQKYKMADISKGAANTPSWPGEVGNGREHHRTRIRVE